MNRIVKFFHEFLHPHCDHCSHDKECKSCDTLKQQLDLANEDKRKLLELILDKNKVVEEPAKAENFKPTKSSYIPWSVRQRLLETEDREKAKILRDHNKEQQEINKLEDELGIEKDATGTEERVS